MLDDVEAVVLVGGKGTRLRPLTLSAPKPMLPTAGVPFLAHLLSRIRAAGVRRVVLGTSYMAETFAKEFGGGEELGLELVYVVEDEPLGTGGGIRNVAEHLTAENVLVFNGDVLCGTDLAAVVEDPPRDRRRRHPAPRAGARPPRVRLRAHRRERPGARVPREGARTRPPTRSTPVATSSAAP